MVQDVQRNAKDYQGYLVPIVINLLVSVEEILLNAYYLIQSSKGLNR